MAKKRLRKLRRKVLGRTTAGRLTRAAALAGVIGGGGYLAKRGLGHLDSLGFRGRGSVANRGRFHYAKQARSPTPAIHRYPY